MSRESRIADAVQRVTDYESKTGDELATAIDTQSQTPNGRLWKRVDLAAIFGVLEIEAVVVAAPALAMYLSEGIDFGHQLVRQRLGVGGDFRAVLGDANSEILLSLGVKVSTPWLDAGNVDDPPTAEECEAAKTGIVNQRLNQQRAANNYNAAVDFIHANPAATWSEVAALLTE